MKSFLYVGSLIFIILSFAVGTFYLAVLSLYLHEIHKIPILIVAGVMVFIILFVGKILIDLFERIHEKIK